MACLDEAARPYVTAIAGQMHPSKQTWTERIWRKVMGWGGDEGAPQSAVGAAGRDAVPAQGERGADTGGGDG